MYHQADVHIGRKLRERRMALGMSQIVLGEKLGVSYQQVQKYETGANRVSGSRLWEISRILKSPVSNFFEGLDGQDEVPANGANGEPALGRNALELARAVNAIPDAEVKTKFLRLAKAFAQAS